MLYRNYFDSQVTLDHHLYYSLGNIFFHFFFTKHAYPLVAQNTNIPAKESETKVIKVAIKQKQIKDFVFFCQYFVDTDFDEYKI